MYSPFAHDWLAAFPRRLLFLRAEDLYAAAASRRDLLVRAWAHMGLPPPTSGDEYVSEKAEKRLRTQPYPAWTANKGPIHTATAERLGALFAPFNRELREMLKKDGLSCTAADCDRFLWADGGVP